MKGKIVAAVMMAIVMAGMMPAGTLAESNSVNITLPRLPISIGGIQTENDISYFTKILNYAAGQLGWTLGRDEQGGLSIQSLNPQMEKNILLDYSAGAFIAVDDYYYYGGPQGAIYQAPMENLESIKKIYQLPIWSYGDGNTYVNYGLTKNNDEAWLVYHQGGAVMGSDHYIKLKPDGTCEEVECGYLTFKTFGNITVKVDQWVPPSPGNLMIKYAGQEYKRIGDAAYLFGWTFEKTEDSSSGGPSKDLYLIDHNLYLLACNMGIDRDVSRIYSVNIDTGETVRVSDLKTKSFMIVDGYIYCSSEGRLYKIPLTGGPASPLEIIGSISDELGFQVLNGNVYYVNSLDNALYKLGLAQSLNPGAKVTGMKLEDGYPVCTFQKEAGNPYCMMIFDQNGRVVFKTSDVMKISNISIGQGKLSYSEDTNHNVYLTDFPPFTYEKEQIENNFYESVKYEPGQDLLSFTIPETIPEGYRFYLHVSGRVFMGDKSSGMSFHAFDKESENFSWEKGKTYTYSLASEDLDECLLVFGLVDMNKREFLNAIHISPDGTKSIDKP